MSILADLSITVWQTFLFMGVQVYKMPCAVPVRLVSGCWVVCLVHGDYRTGACLWGPSGCVAVNCICAGFAVVQGGTFMRCHSIGEEQNQVLYPYCLLGAVPSMDLPRPMPTCHRIIESLMTFKVIKSNHRTWGGVKQGRE